MEKIKALLEDLKNADFNDLIKMIFDFVMSIVKKEVPEIETM